MLAGACFPQTAQQLWLPAPSARVLSGADAGRRATRVHAVPVVPVNRERRDQISDREALTVPAASDPSLDKQPGWLWGRSSGSTQKELKAERLRPKKCAPLASTSAQQ